MANIAGLRSRLRTLRTRLQPPPKREVWMPLAVYIREAREDEESEDEEGHLIYYINDDESEATLDRCEKLGITPNVYVVSDEWHPDMDGIDP